MNLEAISAKVQQIHDNIPKIYESGRAKGYDEGMNYLYNSFWDNYLLNPDSRFTFAGFGWRNENFLPNRDIWPTNIQDMFTSSRITDIAGCLSRLGRTINTSKAEGIYYLMRDNIYSTSLFETDTSSCPDLSYFIYNCAALRIIKNIILKYDGSQTFNPTYSFGKLPALEEIRFRGVIGQDGVDFSESPLLSKASYYSIFDTLSNISENKTIALSKEGVDETFKGSSEYTVITQPKTVEIIKNPALTGDFIKVNKSKTYMPFVVEDVDCIYVGDTLRVTRNLFSKNNFTLDSNTIKRCSFSIIRYGEDANETKAKIWSHDDSTYTFDRPGYYLIQSNDFYVDDDNEDETHNWYKYSMHLIEVKELPTKDIQNPITNKTSGEATATLTDAEIEIKSKDDITTDGLNSLGISPGNEAHVSESVLEHYAGLVLDFKFHLNEVSYVESVSWNAYYEGGYYGLYMADVYGSLDGENWYLINNDCQISLTQISDYTCKLLVDVNAVAKYVKLTNLKWKDSCASRYTTNASVTGFELSEGEWSYDEEPDVVVEGSSSYEWKRLVNKHSNWKIDLK